MSALSTFVFEDKPLRLIDRDGEPWFVGKDVCRALDIRNHNDALGGLGADERAEVGIADPSGTKYATIVSEPGLYRLVFKSRKPEAERFKRWIAHDVLPQIRRTGAYAPAAAIEAEPVAAVERRQALELVREARQLYGPARARRLWEVLPALPPVPAAPKPAHIEAAEDCLAHLMDWRSNGGMTVRELINEAMADDTAALLILRDLGIRVVADLELGDGIVVASSHDGVRDLFRQTVWAKGRHRSALRSLKGAAPYKALKYGNGHASLGTFLPLETVAISD